MPNRSNKQLTPSQVLKDAIHAIDERARSLDPEKDVSLLKLEQFARSFYMDLLKENEKKERSAKTGLKAVK